MELIVLAVPDCPNAPVLEARLAQVLADEPDAQQPRITRHIVADEQQAAHWGMHGSPTLLVDGADPFADANTPTSLSCRLYRSPDGTLTGAPSTAQLRHALDHRHG